MELLTLGRPSLIVPDSQQIEQENNASRMAELGVSLTMSYEDLMDEAQSELRNKIQTLLDTPEFLVRSREFAEMAAERQGAVTAAQHLREFAHRLSAY
jgi:UDP:flavonoid glycosyltransferase YjiC (YdhE family)